MQKTASVQIHTRREEVISNLLPPASWCSCTAEKRSLRLIMSTSDRNSAVNLYTLSINIEIILKKLTSRADRHFVTVVKNLEWLECSTL